MNFLCPPLKCAPGQELWANDPNRLARLPRGTQQHRQTRLQKPLEPREISWEVLESSKENLAQAAFLSLHPRTRCAHGLMPAGSATSLLPASWSMHNHGDKESQKF